MKSLVAHILKKDLRHLWPWLALWWALLALTGFYPAWAFDHLMRSGVNYSDNVMPVMLVWLAWFVITLLIVGSLVENDSPINDRVLWRTWPMPPLRLLAAKILFLLCFIVFAALLIKAGILAACHFSWEQALGNLRHFSSALANGLAYAFLAAVLFARPIVGYVVFGLLFFLFSYWQNTTPALQHPTPLATSAAWMFAIIYGATFLASVAAIYLRQRRTLAILILPCGIVVASTLAQIAPHAKITPASLTPSPVYPAFPLALSFNRIAAVTDDGSKSYLVEGNFTGDALPAHTTEVWFPTKSDWALTWPDHTTVAGTQFLGTPYINTDGFPASGLPYRFTNALQAFGIKHLLTTIQYESTTLASLTPDLLDQTHPSPAQLDGNLTFAVGRLEEAVRLSLTPGSIYRDGPNITGVITLEPELEAHQATLTLAEQSVSPNSRYWYDTIEFDLLVNPRRGEAVLGSRVMNDITMISDLSLARVQYTFRFQYFTGPGQVHNLSSDEIRAWLAGAQFVRLRFVPTGSQPGTFTINPLSAPNK